MMNRRWVLAIAAGAVAVCGAGPVAASARAAQVSDPWGKAIEVPGLGALSNGQAAQVFSVSCPSPGNCAAGGDYRNHGRRQGFVVSEKNARWDTAIEVPGLGALNTGGLAEVNEVSCASAGDCAAGGDYLSDGRHHAFVVSERNGAWGTAIEVAGLGRHGAEILTVSCASAGNCAAGGDYTNTFGQQGFVVSEKNGHWGAAIKVPGLGALNTGGAAYVFSVSCASADNCSAGGTYSYNEGSGASLGFVVSERNGRWGHATKVPGLAALNRGGDADVESVSCVSAGNCGADGNYNDGHDHEQGFVVSEKNGRWGQAIEMPGLGALNNGGLAIVLSVSCGSAGDCAAGGWYSSLAHRERGSWPSRRMAVGARRSRCPAWRP